MWLETISAERELDGERGTIRKGFWSSTSRKHVFFEFVGKVERKSRSKTPVCWWLVVFWVLQLKDATQRTVARINVVCFVESHLCVSLLLTLP